MAQGMRSRSSTDPGKKKAGERGKYEEIALAIHIQLINHDNRFTSAATSGYGSASTRLNRLKFARPRSLLASSGNLSILPLASPSSPRASTPAAVVGLLLGGGANAVTGPESLPLPLVDVRGGGRLAERGGRAGALVGDDGTLSLVGSISPSRPWRSRSNRSRSASAAASAASAARGSGMRSPTPGEPGRDMVLLSER